MRERKRQQRHDHIVDCARALFQDRGYAETTMEEIAARADISPPTVYRYFPTKSALLIALFWKARSDRAPALEEFHRRADALDAVAAVAGLLHLNNQAGATAPARKLWREALAELLRSHDTPNDEFRRIKQEFEQHLERLLRQLQQTARLSPDAPLPAMVAVLYAIASESFSRMIANEFATPEAERQAIHDQVALVLKGWLPD